MDAPSDAIALETITDLHGIAAAVFVPFAVVRLRDRAEATGATLAVILRGIEGSHESQRKVNLSWSAASRPLQPPGVQEHVVTEWAALAVACAVVWLYGSLRIRAVAAPGDAFDFWVTDGEQQYGLEVSGTITEDVESRHREKVRQLRSNPYGVDGYVVAVSFPARRVIFSFNRFEEEDQ